MREYGRAFTESTPNFAVVFLELKHALEVFDCLKWKKVTSAIEHVRIEIGSREKNKRMEPGDVTAASATDILGF